MFLEGDNHSQNVCLKLMEAILKEDKCVSNSKHTDGNEMKSCNFVADLIRLSPISKMIQDEFGKCRLEFLESTALLSACPTCHGEKKENVHSLHKSNTFPKRRQTDTASSSKLEIHSRMNSRKSVRSLPESIISGRQIAHSETASDSSSIFSDDISDAYQAEKFISPNRLSSLLSCDQKGDLHRKDFEVYKAVSACAQHPALVPLVWDAELTDVLHEPMLLHKNIRSVADVLTHYVRLIFSLSSKKHRQYQAMLFPEKEKQSYLHENTQLHLFNELAALERNEKSYYKESFFQSRKDYKKWKESEKRCIFHLIDKDSSLDTTLQETDIMQTNRCLDYQNLLNKILQYETGHGLQTRSDSVSSAMSNGSIIEIDAVTLNETSHKKLLSVRANRLLKEFNLRYRITPVTQIVLFLQCLESNRSKNILSLSKSNVLQEILDQMKKLLQILVEENNFILRTELDIMMEISANLIRDIESMMCSFLSQWRPQNKELALALALLETCYSFLQKWNAVGVTDYPACVTSWFRLAILDDYRHHLDATCSCCEKQSKSRYIRLLSTVQHSIETVKKGCRDGYQVIFGPYIQDVAKVTASILHEIVIKDVIELTSHIVTFGDRKIELEFRTNVILATKVAEFESCVLQTGFRPLSDECYFLWRKVFHQQSLVWLSLVSKQMEKMVLECVRHDKYIIIKTDNEKPQSKSFEAGRTNADNNGMVLTRVNANQDERNASSDNGDTSNHHNYSYKNRDVETNSRIRLNTLLSDTNTITATCAESQFSFNVPNASDCSTESGSVSFTSTSSLCDEQEYSESTSSPCLSCTYSVVDFVVLLCRYSNLVGDLANAVYKLPDSSFENTFHSSLLNSYKQNFHEFRGKVFKNVSAAVDQYLDCLLNLDICIFPKKYLQLYVSRERVPQLNQRAKEKTVDCCRHQLEGNRCCIDDVDDSNKYQHHGVYFKMSKRINNALIIFHGVDLIWKHVSHAVDVRYMTSLSRAVSSSSLSLNSSTSNLYQTQLQCLSASVQSLPTSEVTVICMNDDAAAENKQLINTGDETMSSITTFQDVEKQSAVNLEEDFALNDEETTLEENQANNVKKSEWLQRHDTNNNGISRKCEQENRFEETVVVVQKSTCGNEPRTITVSHGSQRSSAPSDKTNAVRNKKKGISSPETPESCYGVSSTNFTLENEPFFCALEPTKATAETCLRSLCGVLSWRLFQYFRRHLKKTFATTNLKIELAPKSTKLDVETCERHCKKIIKHLRCLLDTFSKWLQRDALCLFHEFFWDRLAADFKNRVKCLSEFADKARVHSFFLLTALRLMLKEFDSFHLLSVDEMTKDLQAVLSVLELFVMPSPNIAKLYQSMSFNQNHCSIIHSSVVRELCRKQKSFSGNKFLECIIINTGLNKKREEDKLKALEMCKEMLLKNVIRLVFVKNAGTNRLPDLIECLTSSYDSQDSWNKGRPDRANSLLTTTSSDFSFSESDNDHCVLNDVNCFYADDSHFYGFVVTSSNIPSYYFNESDGGDLKDESLKDILMARRYNDSFARDFLRQKGFTKQWFQFCMCIP